MNKMRLFVGFVVLVATFLFAQVVWAKMIFERVVIVHDGESRKSYYRLLVLAHDEGIVISDETAGRTRKKLQKKFDVKGMWRFHDKKLLFIVCRLSGKPDQRINEKPAFKFDGQTYAAGIRECSWEDARYEKLLCAENLVDGLCVILVRKKKPPRPSSPDNMKKTDDQSSTNCDSFHSIRCQSVPCTNIADFKPASGCCEKYDHCKQGGYCCGRPRQ